MMCIICKVSKKGNKYVALSINDVIVTFDINTIERVALTFGISNIEINNLNVDDIIKL